MIEIRKKKKERNYKVLVKERGKEKNTKISYKENREEIKIDRLKKIRERL